MINNLCQCYYYDLLKSITKLSLNYSNDIDYVKINKIMTDS